ncbi:MAG: ABC-2 transporter permease [Lachnospiraceae bacterium]|nr:ABC-2 transporter permease [Lachnospiraceae bacterium]
MKGLIYKDLFLGKKNYIVLLGLTLGVVFLGILVGLGTRFGNLKDYSVEEKAYFFYMFVYATYAMVLLFTTEIFTSIEKDKKSGWKKIEYTMPITAKKRVGAWYLTCGMILGCCVLIGLLNAGLMAFMFGQTITVAIFKNMAIILVSVMVIPLVGIPLFQRFSAKTLEIALSVLLIIVAIALIVFLIVIEMTCENEELFRAAINNLLNRAGVLFEWFLYLSPIIIPLLIVSSFALSVRWYQRRGK